MNVLIHLLLAVQTRSKKNDVTDSLSRTPS
ncbi:Uncharacterised protein [Klebsiella pneumoniae]|nr:Uncharacterised protein [Klebsiella pneumoniae]